MGYYIETPMNKGKAEYLVREYGAEEIEAFDWSDVPEDKALICVVDNGPFEAAAVAYSEREFQAFAAPDDVGESTTEEHGDVTVMTLRPERQRPRTWLLMDKDTVRKLSPNAPL